MPRLLALVAFLGAASALKVNTDEGANPIRRIVTLMQNMQKEIQAEGEKEKKNYDKFMCFCDGNTKSMTKEAEEARQAAESANARAEEKTAEKKQLDLEIAEHRKDRSEAQMAVKSASELRAKEKAKYEQEAGDSKQNLDALTAAIAAITKGMGGSFLQTQNGAIIKKLAVSTASLTTFEREDLLNFLQGKTTGKGAFGDYQAASGEIVGILKQMKDDMDKDLGGIVAAEEEAQQTFDELIAAKNAEIKAATSAIEAKTVRSGEAAVAIVEAKQEGKTALETASETDRFLANMATACKTKKEEWEERTKIRNDELAAIADAIAVLNDDDSLDIFKKTLPSPGVSLLQRGRGKKGVFQEAFNQVHSGAVATNSKRLKMVAYLLQQGKVSFDKVLKMIDNMIEQLGKEQDQDDEHKRFCNSELNKQGDMKTELKKDINGNTSQIDSLASEIAELDAKIKEIQSQIADLDKMVAEATENRKAENAEFKSSQVELNAAKQLLLKAKNRLAKFYSPDTYVPPKEDQLTEEERLSGQRNPQEVQYIPGTTQVMDSAFSLAQKPDEAPETWEGSYKAKKGKGNSVMKLMDMLLKDLDGQMQEAEHEEKQSQKDYEQNMADAQEERATKTKSMMQKTEQKAAAEEAKNEAEGALRSNGDELANVNDTIQKLHADCDFLLENFDYRREARRTEIQSLKDAKAVLNGANYN